MAAGLNEKEMNSVPFLKTPVDVMRHGLAANNLKAEATPAHPVQLIQAQVDHEDEWRSGGETMMEGCGRERGTGDALG